MPERFLAFKYEDNGDSLYDPVGAVEDLTGQPLEEFVDDEVEAWKDTCLRRIDGNCGLTGDVCRDLVPGRVATSMGGYVEGMVGTVEVAVTCTETNCPSDQPARTLARRIGVFTEELRGDTGETNSAVALILRTASEEAEALVNPVRKEARETILDPAQEESSRILTEARIQAKAYVKPAEDSAAAIRAAAMEKATELRKAAVSKLLTKADLILDEKGIARQMF